MKKLLILSTAALALVGGAAIAQTATTTAKGSGELASKAQLEREHKRAVKAGDTANDPMNSASSDALNQKQLQGLPSPTGAAPAPDAAPATPPAPDASGTAPAPAPDAATPPPPPAGADAGGPTTPPPATPDASAPPPAPGTSAPPPTLPSTDSGAASSSSSSSQ